MNNTNEGENMDNKYTFVEGQTVTLGQLMVERLMRGLTADKVEQDTRIEGEDARITITVSLPKSRIYIVSDEYFNQDRLDEENRKIGALY